MSTTFTCTSCGATMREDQSWCSLCYAQVAEPFDPLTAPLEEVLDLAEDPALAAGATFESQPRPAEPRPVLDVPQESRSDVDERPHVDSAPAPARAPVGAPAVAATVADDDGVTDVDVMLSMLAAEHRAMDPTSALTDRFEDKSTRIAIMVGGTLLVGAMLFLMFTVLGAIF